MIGRWRTLWSSAGLQGDSTPAGFDLLTRYAEPHRRYHTLRHIEHCLEELEAARSLAVDLDGVALALWYHDAVYDPRRGDNEERSAELAKRTLSAARLPPARISRVTDLILASVHREAPAAGDAALFVDIDLSILGADAETFDAYERQVREEYAWVEEELFRKTRAGLLAGFVVRPAIYSTTHFRDRYEAAARGNLQRSIDRLRGGP